MKRTKRMGSCVLLILNFFILSCGKIDDKFITNQLPGRDVEEDPGDSSGGGGGICNPFGGQGIPKIQANLYEGNNTVQNFGDFLKINKLLSNKIYFTELNIPPQSWEDGFEDENGKLLENSRGEPLVEWFGLEMTSGVKLSSIQEEGYYLFQSMADDGFSLKFEINGSLINSIDSDYITSPSYGCVYSKSKTGLRLFRMTRKTLLKMHATYFQGPRNFLALQLFMRKIADLDEYTGDYVNYNPSNFTCGDHPDLDLLTQDNYYLSNKVSCK